MLPEGALPEHLQRRAERIPTTTVEAASLKIDVALSGRVSLPRHQAWRDDDLDLRDPIISWHTYEDHVRAWDDTVGRRWPDPIPFIGIVPTSIDPTQAPSGQDTFWLWSGITPANPTEKWEDVRDRIGNEVLKECATYYEGLEELEIGRRVFNAPDLEERFHVPGGNVYHVDPVAFRFGPMRPAPGFGSYETPVPGLWLSGAGTHPTGGISGIPGQVAAKTLIKKVAKGDVPRWRPVPASPVATNGNGNGSRPTAEPATTTSET
jgi:phytoene dehydrogenase-like protein